MKIAIEVHADVALFAGDGTSWSLAHHIKADNADPMDRFSFSVATSRDGTTIAIGAADEASASRGIGGDSADNSAMNAGAVYILR